MALYEQEGGRGLVPRLAVKQYSRSSADQEAPLPFELRPVGVLQMTMGYLLHRIVELCDSPDVNVGDWYHFLWDRTRGIRKDITQQEMCCQGSVELVEQCARFHIHCSARLVAEEPAVFDQKINTENLTKCLQTLKYMYHDLHLKGESCPNEAEFRAYIILLNLNDGNFMWEVQQLKPDIQKSPEVKFAMDVYSALDKNNYVRFFKLVKTTTYLNACVLMRYFVQVRNKALETLLRSYSNRSMSVQYPLSKLVRVLGFDDTESAADFFISHGLKIEMDTYLILDQTTFIIPEFPYTLDRSDLIEKKRLSSVGEVICGKPLPPKLYETHIPQNSFDERGYLIFNKYISEADIRLEPNIDMSQDDSNESKGLFMRKTESPKLQQKEFTVKTGVSQKPDGAKNFFGDGGFFNTPYFGDKKQESSIFEQTDKPPFAKDIFSQTKGTNSVLGEQSASSRMPLYEEQAQGAPGCKEPSKENIFSRPAGNQSIFGTLPSNASNIFGGNSSVPITKTGGFAFPINISEQTSTGVFGTSLGSQAASNLPQIRMPITPPHENTNHLKTLDEKRLLEQKMLRERVAQQQLLVQERLEKEKEEQRKLEERRRQEDLKRKVEEAERLKREADQRQRQEEQKRLLEEARLREVERLRVIEEERKRKEEEIRHLRLLQEEKERQRNLEISNTVVMVISDILLSVEKIVHTQSLQKISKRIRDRLLRGMLHKWRENVVKNKRKRKAVDNCPMWVGTKSVRQEANELYSYNQDLTLQMMRRYRLGKADDINMLAEERINKINLVNLTYTILAKRFYDLGLSLQKNIFWKVTISLPDKQELHNGLTRIEETLDSFFRWKSQDGSKILIEHSKAYSQSITYCIERQQGHEVKSHDSNGIIFIADDFNTHVQQRLIEVLKCYGVFVKIPVVIVLQKYDPQSQNKLKALITEKIVSDYVILIDHFVPYNLMGLIEEGLIFLAGKIEKPPPLELDTFRNFIMKHLCFEIWKKANSFAKWNSNYRTCLRNPRTVIKLYNEGLGNIRKIILNKACQEYNAFPVIFKKYTNNVPDFLPCNYKYLPDFWTDEKYNRRLGELLDSLKLPDYDFVWPPKTQSELELNVLSYCEEVFKDFNKVFFKIMSVLLRYFDPKENFNDVKCVMWTDVVEVLGLELLKQLDLSLKCTEYYNKSVFEEYVVVYDANILNDYQNGDWYYVNNPVIKSTIERELKEQSKHSPIKQPIMDVSTELDMTLEKVSKFLSKERDTPKMKQDIDEFNAMVNDLESSIHIHKKISSSFENTIKGILEDI